MRRIDHVFFRVIFSDVGDRKMSRGYRQWTHAYVCVCVGKKNQYKFAFLYTSM